jgi:hypothetical protein
MRQREVPYPYVALEFAAVLVHGRSRRRMPHLEQVVDGQTLREGNHQRTTAPQLAYSYSVDAAVIFTASPADKTQRDETPIITSLLSPLGPWPGIHQQKFHGLNVAQVPRVLPDSNAVPAPDSKEVQVPLPGGGDDCAVSPRRC